MIKTLTLTNEEYIGYYNCENEKLDEIGEMFSMLNAPDLISFMKDGIEILEEDEFYFRDIDEDLYFLSGFETLTFNLYNDKIEIIKDNKEKYICIKKDL